MNKSNRLGIYIHWPYCISKCPYCDFNSHKIKNYDPDDWLLAYENQIKYFKEYLISQNFKNVKLSSIFFGGGTPSLMEPNLIEQILNFVNKIFRFIEGGDTTITQNKRETMFIQLLESLCAEEAEFLINVVSKKLNKVYKGLTANLIKDAFHWDDDFMQKQPSYPV